MGQWYYFEFVLSLCGWRLICVQWINELWEYGFRVFKYCGGCGIRAFVCLGVMVCVCYGFIRIGVCKLWCVVVLYLCYSCLEYDIRVVEMSGIYGLWN